MSNIYNYSYTSAILDLYIENQKLRSDLEKANSEISWIKSSIGEELVPVNGLNSLYSCDGPYDDNPKLIATGSNSTSGKLQGIKNCTDWGVSTEFKIQGKNRIIMDSSSTNVYVRTSNTEGECYDVVGSLITKPANLIDHDTTLLLPSTKVTCDDDGCFTEELRFIDGWNNVELCLPSLPVSCVDITCSTAPISITNKYIINIPAQEVECNSFPCIVPSIEISRYITWGDEDDIVIPEQEINFVDGGYILSSIIADIFLVPGRNVICNNSSPKVCSISSVDADSISLRIPSQSVSCTGSACNATSLMRVKDSSGFEVNIQVENITCVENSCRTEDQVVITEEGYNFNIPSQLLYCEGSECSIPEIFLNAGGDRYWQDNFLVPSLVVGSVAPTSASLAAFCQSELYS